MTNTLAKRQNGNGYPATFGNVVDNIFQNSLRRFFDNNFWEAETGSVGSVPVNIRETEQHYELDVVAPGCRKEDFNIGINDNVLTISMARREENKQHEKAGWVRNEYSQREFSRSFTLDESVDLDNIKATYNDGILRLVLGKNEKAKKVSRRIDIK